MRLLLDEMHAPVVAEELRNRGHDVVAIAAAGELRGIADEEVFARAAAEGRATVTENVADFLPIAHHWVAEGRTHHGLVLTSPERFVRSNAAYPGDLVVALDAFLSDPPVSGHSWTWWLQPA